MCERIESPLVEDAQLLAADESIPWRLLEGKRVVVTGATGLIGRSLVLAILARNRFAESRISVCVLVRDTKKAERMLGGHSGFEIREWDAQTPNLGIEGLRPDYIFHCANATDSEMFITHPVEVVDTTIGGARSMLDLARAYDARLCLLSTMETYGVVMKEGRIAENDGGFVDAMSVRNSYPEAKRLAEMLCSSYYSEFGVSTVVVRLVQTFGPGVPKGDRRVFAEFARCAIAGNDIVLLTEGTKKNAYLYTRDAVAAILFATLKGDSGVAYNAANDDTFCSVREMAAMVASDIAGGEISVRIEPDHEAAKKFRKGSVLRLDTSRLMMLGWKPTVGLREMYSRMIGDW